MCPVALNKYLYACVLKVLCFTETDAMPIHFIGCTILLPLLFIFYILLFSPGNTTSWWTGDFWSKSVLLILNIAYCILHIVILKYVLFLSEGLDNI